MKNDKLIEIEELAKCFFVPKQVALVAELDMKQFLLDMQNENSDVYKAYWKGWYTSIYNHRKKVLKLAEQGSSPAQTLVEKMIADATANQFKR